MRISVLLNTFVAVAIVMVLTLAATNLVIIARLDRLSVAQELAQASGHDVSNLLVLTHEYAQYSEERSAQQWRMLLSKIVRNLEAMGGDVVPVPPEALTEVRLLPELFRLLVSSKTGEVDLKNRQHSLLLSQLQSSSQSLADSMDRWSKAITEQRHSMERSYHLLTNVFPVIMLFLLSLLAFLLHRRILFPLRKLLLAVRATANGDLSVRSATGMTDELGELSSTFDEMAIDLVSELRREVTERKQAEELIAEQADFNRRIFNSSDAHMVVVDQKGIILSVNDAWCAFARQNQGFAEERWGVGASYFVSFDENWGETSQALEAFAGVRMVQHGQLPNFSLEYSCDTLENGKRWFLLTVFPLLGRDGAVLISHSNITRRRQAEEALSNEKAFLRSLIDSASDLISFKGVNGLYLGCNKAFEEYIGRAELEQIGGSDTLLFGNEQGEIIAQSDNKVLGSGEVVRAEEWIESPTGKRQLFDSVKAPIRNHDGTVTGLVVISRDITRQRREEQLIAVRSMLVEYSVTHTLEELLTKTIDTVESLTESKVGYFHFLQENQQTLTLQAWSTGTVKDFCTVQGNDRHYEVDKAGVWVDCIRQRRSVIHNDYASLPHRKGLPPGHATVIRELAVPIFRSEKIVAILGIGNKSSDYSDDDVRIVSRFADLVWDIAERKLVEESLRESNERFSAAFNNAPIMISLSTLEEGVYLDVNQCFLTTSGFSREEVIGSSSLELGWISAADRNSLKESMARDGRIAGRELNLRTKAGKQRICLFWGEMVALAGQQRFLSIALDITEQRIIERQFVQAQKMESIGQLAGGIAHDFNNKLSVIFGNVELAWMDMDHRNKLREHLQEIQLAAEHSRDITNRLLTFSRLDVTHPKSITVNSAIAETLRSLSRLIGAQISVTFTPSPEAYRVMMDPVQLDQIVMNMAINARDAMPDGGTLEIETRNFTVDNSNSVTASVPGEYVMITFRDTGIGMDEETLVRIFEPFFTTKEVGRGTGLGLATIYGIVTQNNGFIDVSSIPGSGSSFRVFLPRATAVASEVVTAKVDKVFSPANCSLLLVEDEKALRHVVTEFLTEYGFQVHEAALPENALQLARDLSMPLDMIMTDIVMPQMNGLDLVEKIREVRPNIVCVFTSGYTADHDVIRKASETGGNFIQKPYDFKKLHGQLKQILAGDPEIVISRVK